MRNPEERLDLHRAFWSRGPQTRPVAAFKVGDFFFARHFRAARRLLVRNKTITPDMINVGDYLADYERMFAEIEKIGQDGFWTAEPYTGIPWMEAILGCEVRANEESFSSKPFLSPADADRVVFDPSNPWFLKYMEFTTELVKLSRGRFPVGQPITRGPSDMVGALLGQTEMVFALADHPDDLRSLIRNVTSVFLAVMAEQRKVTPAFRGGSALGFYHAWAPGPSIWFQDDLSALLSPELYREFFLESASTICAGYDYTAIHLHPTSFFILDELLSIERLRVIEVNKDVGGPSVAEMLPVLRRILDTKGLILWGDLSLDDLALIKQNLPPRGMFLNIVAPSLDEARARNEYIKAWE
jgi:hypothetical protein